MWSDADQIPGAHVYIDAWQAGFWWSSTRISHIQALYAQQDRRYFTADTSHPSDYDTTISVEGYSTTLPNAHYDWDDDPEFPQGGNGYADESEVTVTNPSPLQAYWSYDFLTIFRDMTRGNTSGYLEVNAQRSYWLGPEYDTDDYTVPALATPNYDSYGLIGLTGSMANAATAPANISARATASPLPRDLNDLPAYRELMLARQRGVAAAWRGNVNVNVTFKSVQPLHVISAMSAKGLNVAWFDAVGTANGRTTSLGTRVDGSGVRDAVLARLLSETHATFSGVYSVRGQISASALAALQQDERVDLVTLPALDQLQQGAATGRGVKAPPSVFWLQDR